jgi:hypothetical protein
MEWEEWGCGWDLLMLRSNEGFARAHGCARVYNEGNFVARVFDDFNNRVPITQ